ncbi:MAG: 23S rRNA (guanosine(2251)-2'-O)-methyltransferase RlmB [Rickettsiales bacterium]|nr:23S rRNA (guanosine(2251)-2'-O)-methyltransferase RlmB [Rickettsiales bacterium]
MNKHRHSAAEGGYWLYGLHAVSAALANSAREVKRVVVTRNAAERIMLLPRHPHPELAESAALEKLLGTDAVHQGAALYVKPLESLELADVLSDRPILLLDQVSDPHNVGAILRSAAAFGAAALVVPKHGAPREGGAMAKAAAGALDLLPLVTVTNLVAAIEELKKAGYWVAGLDGEAPQALHQAKLTPKTALVLGSEGKGIRRLVGEHCDLLVKLPIQPLMESLNVSNAAAIALYELSRIPS